MAGILKVDQVQSDSNLSFQVAGANVAYMNSTGLQMTGGQITAGGNTLLTASGLIYANAGIAFPATQSASVGPNTLDDYEEGTFSPVLKLGATTQTQTSGGPNARYVKIGRMVYFAIETYFTKSGTGDFNVSSLPFTSAATRQCDVNFYFQFYTSSMPSTSKLTYIQTSTTEFTPQYMPSGGTQTASINDTMFTGSTNYFYAAGTYMSDA